MNATPIIFLHASAGWLCALLAFLATSVSGAGFAADKIRALDTAITNALATGAAPGAVLRIETTDEAYERAFGLRAVVEVQEPMTPDTVFDVASLTKVIATTPAIMALVEDGRVKLEAPVKTYLPEFTGNGRDEITVRHLLTHTSGLRPDTDLKEQRPGYEAGIQLVCAETPRKPPGAEVRYSDVNFQLLGEIVRRVAGQPLDAFTAQRIFGPLKMVDTGFRPSAELIPRIAPTEPSDGRMLRGVVHDPRARLMGGVAGHAGLFSTAADLSRFCRMLLHRGELEGVRVLKPESVELMTTVQTPASLKDKRGLGWDIDSAYSKPRGDAYPVGSYGHTGFTGTSLWIDPSSKSFVILLTSRLHPTGKGNVTELRQTVGTLAAEAAGLTRKPVAVLNGIDVLKRDGYAPLRGKRLGLVTNHTGHDRERNPTIDLLHSAPGVKLVALFSPEHGIRGALDQAKISDTRDEKTGLPVFSLYGVRRSPAPEQLRELDALVFDIQDIGCRFYTYVSTMGNCLEAAARAGKKFYVFDRVNPIGGLAVEGPLHEGKSTFVAYHRLPLRHGMTVGELAQMFNEERGWKADLAVIRCEGWKRSQWFDETALPWTNPSPNMRSLRAATLYPGVGLLESAVSVGRGTDTPFEVLGAPYVNEKDFVAELNRAGLDGIAFTPLRFTPTASTFKDKECGGVRFTILDRAKLNSVDLGLTLALTLQRLYGKEFAADKMKSLLESPAPLEAIKAGRSLKEIKSSWAGGLSEFQKRRAKFLIYE